MKQRNPMIGPFLRLDIAMVIGLIGSILFIYRGCSEPQDAIAVSPLYGWQIAGLVLAVLVLSWVANFLTGLDRAYHDEYALRGLAIGSNIAIYVTIIVFLALDIFGGTTAALPEPNADLIVGVLMGSWSAGYFVRRFKGDD